jgi:hypothetical protein
VLKIIRFYKTCQAINYRPTSFFDMAKTNRSFWIWSLSCLYSRVIAFLIKDYQHFSSFFSLPLASPVFSDCFKLKFHFCCLLIQFASFSQFFLCIIGTDFSINSEKLFAFCHHVYSLCFFSANFFKMISLVNYSLRSNNDRWINCMRILEQRIRVI